MYMLQGSISYSSSSSSATHNRVVLVAKIFGNYLVILRTKRQRVKIAAVYALCSHERKHRASLLQRGGEGGGSEPTQPALRQYNRQYYCDTVTAFCKAGGNDASTY